MKKITSIIAAGLLLLAFTAKAQIGTADPSGVSKQNVLTNTAVYFIPGATLTNIPVTAANWIAVPKGTFGIYVLGGATNAATTTNIVFAFEGLQRDRNGHTQVVDNVTFNFSPAWNGTSRTSQKTNWLATDRNLVGLDALRLKSIDNTNVFGVFVTNMFRTTVP